MANIYQKQINSNPAVQQIGPNQTFGAHISTSAFMKPLPQPLFDTEVTPLGQHTEIKFFGWSSKRVVFDFKKFRKATTRSVLKLIERGLVVEAILSEKVDARIMASPIVATEGNVESGDVILGIEAGSKLRRALVLCHDEFMIYDTAKLGLHENPGFHVLWDEDGRWGKRVKKLTLSSIREAYDLAGPEVCMALAARASRSPEIQMAGKAVKISI